MPDELMTPEEMDDLYERGSAIYQKLKASLEPEYSGQSVAIDVDSGDYAIGKTSAEASRAMTVRRPKGLLLIKDIGPYSGSQLPYKMLASGAQVRPKK